MTGYLTMIGTDEGKTVDLVIPNKEIRGIFTSQIWQWFEELAAGEKEKLSSLREALLEGNAAAVERAWRTDSGFSMPELPEDV